MVLFNVPHIPNMSTWDEIKVKSRKRNNEVFTQVTIPKCKGYHKFIFQRKFEKIFLLHSLQYLHALSVNGSII